jgi:hypothetical protein
MVNNPSTTNAIIPTFFGDKPVRKTVFRELSIAIEIGRRMSRAQCANRSIPGAEIDLHRQRTCSHEPTSCLQTPPTRTRDTCILFQLMITFSLQDESSRQKGWLQSIWVIKHNEAEFKRISIDIQSIVRSKRAPVVDVVDTRDSTHQHHAGWYVDKVVSRM